MALAQWTVTGNSPITIDFDQSVAGVNSGTYLGSGFALNPAAGFLDAAGWAVNGWSDGNLSFGMPSPAQVPNDFARGALPVPVSTPGLYAFSSGNITTGTALGIQPGTHDWAPGTLTLRVLNASGQTLTSADFAYLLYVRNDQDHDSNFDFSYSQDDSNYISVPALHFTSPKAPDSAGFVSHALSTSLSGLSVPNNGFLYLRFSGSDTAVSSSDKRDEFALDNLTLGNFAFSGPLPVAGDANQDGVVNTADVQSFLAALVDIPSFQATHSGLNTAQIMSMLDVDGNGAINDADVQALIAAVATAASGGGQLWAVPELSGASLLACGGTLFVLAMGVQKAVRRRFKRITAVAVN
jgi:hypothetical protein